jgi:hypothetical protein
MKTFRGLPGDFTFRAHEPGQMQNSAPEVSSERHVKGGFDIVFYAQVPKKSNILKGSG